MTASPILSLFNETITSLCSIRSLKLKTYFLNVMKQRIDSNWKCSYLADSMTCWFDVYIQILFNFCVLILNIYFGLKLKYFNNPNQDCNLLLLSIWWYNALFLQIQVVIFAHDAVDKSIISVQKMFFY
eukprot:296219_1